MCFNATASMGAFTFGSICSILLLLKKYYFYAIFSFSIVIMQLTEYFAHIALKTKNKQLNNISSKCIYWIIFLQPIIYSTFIQIFPPTDITFLYKDYIKIFYIPLLLCYFAVVIYYYFYLDSNNLLYTTYLFPDCSSICRLNWNFFNSKPIFLYLYIILYFAIFKLFLFTDKNRIVSIVNNYLLIVLLLSLVYISIIGAGIPIPKILTTIGSLWCFLCVFYGLILLFTLK